MPPTFKIAVTDPDPGGRIMSAVEAGAALLTPHLASDGEITVAVSVADLHGATAEVASVEVFQDGDLWESAAARKLETGADPNGDAPEIQITVDPARAEDFSPQAFIHEVLHGIAFMGAGEGAEFGSPLDAQIRGGKFTGSAAQAIYGAPVPMVGNHLAVADLMNPYGPAEGHSLSALDLAILSDVGVKTREVFGTIGNDILSLTSSDDIAYGGYGDDELLGAQGDDTLWGGYGDDVVRGGRGVDGLSGGVGSDTLYGDIGNDVLDGGAGSDLFIFRPGDGHDRIDHFELSDHLVIPGPYTVTINREALETVISYGTSDSITLTGTAYFDAAWILPTG